MNIILNFWNKHIWTITFVICLPLILAFISQKVYGSNSDIGEQRVCLAQNIYFESANQPDAGRVAVAQVVLNRVDDLQFPNTICGVVYQAKMRKLGLFPGTVLLYSGIVLCGMI